jgi:predicted ATP-grasp superfamily ATP-dependent carboligase
VRCVVVGPPDSAERRSRFVEAGIDAVAPTALAERDDDLVAALLAFAQSEGDRPVIVCDSDEALGFLDHNRAELEPAFRMLLPPSDLLRSLIDKARFQELAEELGLPVPRGVAAMPARQPPPDLPLPLVVKPVPHRGTGWNAVAGDEKAVVAETEPALDALWRRLAEADIEVLAQEAVPGPEREIFSYHAYVDVGDKVAGWFTGRKIRTFPRERGMSTALTTTNDPAVAELGVEMLTRIGLRGPVKLDFKRAPNGDLRLLEVNPRFTLWSHPGAVAGVNLPLLLYADLAGRPRPPRRRARPGVRWVSLRRDLGAARAEGMPATRWAAWALRCETNSAFAWRDPGPILSKRPVRH